MALGHNPIRSPGLGRRDLLRMGLAAAALPRARAEERRNVLFIAIDDLRPWLGSYGDPIACTPHIDTLARSGVTFARAYCQQALCSPSRVSMLTGLRPDTTGIMDLTTELRQTLPDAVTLPQHFANHGYRSYSLGKIFHGSRDDPASWSEPSWWPNPEENPGRRADVMDRNEWPAGTENPGGEKPSWAAPDVNDTRLSDGRIATKAIELIEQNATRPFFVAAGFVRPHIPLVAPRRYFEWYPKDKLKLASNAKPPLDVPQWALTNWGEIRNYSDIPRQGPLTDEQSLNLIRAYYACVSYVDSQVGRMVKRLRELDLLSRTVIALWGDHGFHLGDNGLWGKYTNFETATRTPLIVSAPGMRARAAVSPALVEAVDIYPTLAELSGLPAQPNLEGHSFAPLLDTPARPWKSAAFSQYPRGKVMGRSLRTHRYRYTEWAEAGRPPVGVELYDYEKDPGETANLADHSANTEFGHESARSTPRRLAICSARSAH